MPSSYQGVSFDLTGDRQLVQALTAMDNAVRMKIARQAMVEACEPLVVAAQQKAPVRYGILRNSIQAVVRSYATGIILGIVGPLRKEVRVGKRKVNPANYAHLVEFGHRIAKPMMQFGKKSLSVPEVLLRTKDMKNAGAANRYNRKRERLGEVTIGESQGTVPAHPFMRPAFETTKGAMIERMIAVLWRGMLREAKSQIPAASLKAPEIPAGIRASMGEIV